LKMTSVKEAPGANAVILYRELVTDDNNYVETEYERIKILTEAGRKYADVELRYFDAGKRITDVAARTIHPDGTEINFNGKVYTKSIYKGHGINFVAKAFTMPDVTVGSIIEWKVTRRWDQFTIYGNTWRVQDNLFTKHAKFLKKPFSGELDVRGSSRVRWNYYNTPANVKVEDKAQGLTLEVDNVPAFEPEENMPPEDFIIQNVKVYWGGSDMTKAQEFWKNEGHDWVKEVNKFIGHSGAVQDAAHQAAPGDGATEARLRQLYARAQKIRNFTFERNLTQQETKQENIKDVKDAQDVITRDYGTRRQINLAFIAMARAAGFEADAMKVADREDTFFDANMLTSEQLSRLIAVVNVAGKDVFLDPGTKYCPYGLLDWRVSSSSGIRQVHGDDTKLDTVPSEGAKYAGTERKSTLTLDDEGNLTGTVNITYRGLEALTRRLNGIDSDDAEHRRTLQQEAQSWFGNGADVKLVSLNNWESTDLPISAAFTIKVPGFASLTGTRLLFPATIFQSGYRRTFDHETRKYPVYFEFPYVDVDDSTVELPKDVKVESVPQRTLEQTSFSGVLLDGEAVGPNTLHLRRQLLVGGILFPVAKYAELRAFFEKVRAADSQQIILKSTESSSRIDSGSDAVSSTVASANAVKDVAHASAH